MGRLLGGLPRVKLSKQLFERLRQSATPAFQRVKSCIQRGDSDAKVERHRSRRALRKLGLPEFVLNAERTQAFEQILADLTQPSSTSSSDSAPAAGCSRQETPAAGGSQPVGKAEA